MGGQRSINKTTRILGILLVTLIIIFSITMVIMLIKNLSISPEQKEKIQVNNKLTTNQMINLLMCARYHLTKSEILEQNSITDESMIVFALDYIMISEENPNITSANEYTIAKVSEIEDAVWYIFDKGIDYSKVSFRISGEYIYIPEYLMGRDARIYKFKAREYNQNEDVYTVYIDCLEPSPSQFSEIIEGSVTEYDTRNVMETQIFKYKEKDGRKVLLAYNSVVDW